MAAAQELDHAALEALLAQLPGADADVCGIDEAGRGALAGPVVAAAVVFPDGVPAGLADSKELSTKKREQLYADIYALGIVGVGVVNNDVIDSMGILPANFLAMQLALAQLTQVLQPLHVIVDGNYLAPSFVDHCRRSQVPVACMVKADAKLRAVSAASIIAKVTRDRIMDAHDATFPSYGFAKNAGYPSPAHLAALEQHGASRLHRRSFAPVARAVDAVAP